jgi:hypothetical protein
MRAQPRAQQGPKALHRLHVHFMKAIAIVIPRVFAPAVTAAFRRIAPRFQAAINIVRLRVNTGTRRNRRLDPWRDRPLWDVFQPPNDHLATALDQPEDRGLLRGEGAAAAFPLEASAPAALPFCTTSAGFPWWPATMSTASPATSAVHVGEGFLSTMPGRN